MVGAVLAGYDSGDLQKAMAEGPGGFKVRADRAAGGQKFRKYSAVYSCYSKAAMGLLNTDVSRGRGWAEGCTAITLQIQISIFNKLILKQA